MWSRRAGLAARIMVATLSALLVLVAIDVTVLDLRLQEVRISRTVGASGQTWLVIGSDSRAELPAGAAQSSFGTTTAVSGARADIVLVVHRTPAGQLSTLSIPRDMLVHNRSGQINRLALTYQSGPQDLIDSLCVTLGIPTDHLVVLNFAVFTAVIDRLGGVVVDIPHPIRDAYSGLALSRAGDQRLDGDQALALVRSRHAEQLIDGRWTAVADGALQRTSWGGVIFRAIEQRAVGVANPIVLQQLAWMVSGEAVTDQNTSPTDLAQLAQYAGPAVEVPAAAIRGGLAVTPSLQTYAALAAAGFDRNCR